MSKNFRWSLILLFITNFLIGQNQKNVSGFYSGQINGMNLGASPESCSTASGGELHPTFSSAEAEREGGLNNNLSITISLKQTGNQISGYYHYNKNKIDIPLHGKINSDGTVEINEYQYLDITGYWNGKFSGDELKGNWTSGNKKRTFPFSVKKITWDGLPGEPMSEQVSFGAGEINLTKKKTEVPRSLAQKLFDRMIEEGQIDLENEYQKEMIDKGRKNPSVLFTGEKVDLNNDRIDELIIYPSESEGACTSHNCPIWIFRNDGNDFKQLLYGSAGIFRYLILVSKEKNFHDVTLIEHSSAVEQEFSIYRFNGKEYKPYKCFSRIESVNNRGESGFKYIDHNCNY